MPQMNDCKGRGKSWIAGIALAMMAVSGCVSSTGTIAIDPPPPTKEKPARISLCEIVDREELQYSRRDTEETKLRIGGVLVKYDRTCKVN